MDYYFDPRVLTRAADPFPALAELRENAPVYWSPELRAWLLTGYADVKMSLRSDKYSVDRMRPFFKRMDKQAASNVEDLKALIPLWIAFRDPPEHTRLRMLMGPGLMPKAMSRLAPRIDDLIDELIANFVERGEVDFISDFALLLPGYVILDLLGVPRSDLAMLSGWSNELQLFIGGAQEAPDKYTRAQAGTRDMANYFRDVIRRKRAKPEDDLISALVGAHDDQGSLSEDEMIATCILLLFGGHETTTNLLGNGLLALIRNPDQLQALAADPSLAASAVEECLRYDGPGGAVVRVVTEDHELRGHQLKKGQRTFAMVTAANRDPARFESPDCFDIRRGNNQHLTFGQGIHFCMGAPLARIEVTAAFPKLLARMKNIEVDAATLDWRDSIVQRGLHALPLKFSPN